MEHFSRPEATVQTLLSEFAALKRIENEMGKTEDKRIDTWLQNVKNSERDIDEIQQESTEINDIDGVLDPTDSSRRVNLNKKVIQSIKAAKALKETAVEMFLGCIPEDKLKRFSQDDLISFTSQPPQEIGSGGFGKVYKGQFANGVQVAIKVLVPMDVIEEIFMREMSTILEASHPNIIQLYGFCFNANMRALVYEFMPKGSLDVVLFENPLSVEWETVYGMAIEIAKALAHLHHGCRAQIIHHDLKPSNVLLGPNHCLKITDFGTTRIMDEDTSHITMTHVSGTRGYIAPEMGMYGSRVTYKCDVFSFGKVLFDILGMRSNSQIQSRHSLPNQVWNKFENGELDVAIKDCGLEDYIKKARILSKVALWCIQFTPERRPSMTDVVSALEEKTKIAKPPNPFLAWVEDFSMQQSQDVIYSTVSPVTQESEAQPHPTNSFASLSEGPFRIEENWQLLSYEMEALKQFRDELPLKKARQMAPWMEKVKSKEEEFGVLQIEVKKYKGGSWFGRHNSKLLNGKLLNGKLLHFLRSLKGLLEDGNAPTVTMEVFIGDLSSGYLKRFHLPNLRKYTSDFRENLFINGKGNAFLGQFPNGEKIVVKKMDHDTDETFITEMSALSKTSHLNVVKVKGFCVDQGNIKAIVFEYMPERSLDIILFDTPRDKGIEWEKLYNIAIETAKGLSYLHDGCVRQIIHCSVMASHVLLDQNFCPKITSFGRAILLEGDVLHQTLSEFRGDPSYAAPEMVISSHITAKCDVYSFGLLLFEVLGRRRHIQGRVYFPKVVWELFKKREFEEIIKECGITEQNREKALILCMVALWCIQYTPENRPSMTTVVKMLEKEIKVAMPPDPFVPSVPYSVKPFVDLVYNFD